LNVTSHEKIEDRKVRIAVEVEAAVFNEAVDKVFKAQQRSITVPGFRRGKAPRRIIENVYGKNVFYSDALDDVAPAAWSFAADTVEEKVVGYPTIDGVTVDADLTAHFEFIADLYPEVNVKQYKGLSAYRPHDDVEESAIDPEIEAIRKRSARAESLDGPSEDGDTVNIDYKGTLDGVAFDGGTAENHDLTLGSNSFIQGFEEKLIGVNVGEERDLELTFPEQYHSEELAGKSVVFHVKVNKITRKILPDLDDEFAVDNGFDTLAEYRADLRKQFEAERKADADKSFENALLDELSENTEVDIPESMINEAVDSNIQQLQQELSQYGISIEQYFSMSGLTGQQAKAQMTENAKRQTKITLALEKVCEIEGIDAPADRIEEFYKETAERLDMTVEDVKDRLAEKDVIHDIKIRAAINIIRENGKETPHNHDHGHDHDHDHDHEDHDHEEKPAAKPKRARAKKAAKSEETPSESTEEPAAE